jgi:hypothetical protein
MEMKEKKLDKVTGQSRDISFKNWQTNLHASEKNISVWADWLH